MTQCGADPSVKITPFAILKNPQEIKRSKLFSISTETYFVCNKPYKQKYQWKLNQIYSDHINSIDLTSNPSSVSSEIVIQPNTLDYGLYEFIFQVSISGTSFQSNTSTFIEITSSGLAVYVLPNGVQSILLGKDQSLRLNPPAYSFDFDNLTLMTSLIFKFYCSLNSFGPIDLATYKRNSSLQMQANQTCFTATGFKFL